MIQDVIPPTQIFNPFIHQIRSMPISFYIFFLNNHQTILTMKNFVYVLCCLSFYLMTSCKEQNNKETSTTADTETESLVDRGKYLVNIMDCVACHTPKKMTDQGPVPDMDRYMMGFDGSSELPPLPENVPLGPWILFNGELTATAGPWGTSYAGNLTPHETGLGNWTLEQFGKAMREGKYKGLANSRPIMPPMPVEAYRHLSDEDIEAIFTYLKSIEPIENVVPAYRPPSS